MRSPVERGRDAYAPRSWGEAFRELCAADTDGSLDVDDLELLALSAYLTAHDDQCGDAWTRAHHEWLRRGDPPRAARCAFLYAAGLFFRGDMAPAMGWIARGRRVLEDFGEECSEQAILLVLSSLPIMYSGDPASAADNFRQAVEISTRFRDNDNLGMARLGLGQALCMTGKVADGLALLDEVMVAVTAGEVMPMLAGICYCAMISTCNELFDLRRAREWTNALTRWCDAQPDLVPYRGQCLIHRCEILQVHGAWPDALDAARHACELLSGPPNWNTLGSAHYQLGEVLRLRGEFADSEASYRKASEVGREPEPGLSLLRLAQGHIDVAASSIRRVLDETQHLPERAKVLTANVEIMLAAEDLASARAAADELVEIAAARGAPYLHAVAAHALGAVLLGEGNVREGLAKLREAYGAWRDLDAPHEAARVRVLVGLACRALGDDATAELEFDGARAAFEALGATPDVQRVVDISGSDGDQAAGGLSPRELEVLRLVAAGKKNRQIASELVLSEKTVARHVSNIFAKVGVSSRAAATAFAYENDLV
ncbi:MAG TPA: LuxR C-terminal-related transcriptional regulator [Actinomycetota bacterium]|nr:LuxR C-terminal-related transcriptional regulator [Actinomycetota bacterium]